MVVKHLFDEILLMGKGFHAFNVQNSYFKAQIFFTKNKKLTNEQF